MSLSDGVAMFESSRTWAAVDAVVLCGGALREGAFAAGGRLAESFGNGASEVEGAVIVIFEGFEPVCGGGGKDI